MMLLSCGLVGLFVLRLIKRHGWEYVPIVLLALGASLYFGNRAPAGVSSAMLFVPVAGIHVVTRKHSVADAAR